MPVLPAGATATALRTLIGQRFPDAVPIPEEEARRRVGPVPIGVEGLVRAFPAGGFPRGRLTVWLSLGGATTVLRAACRATIGAGERAAWIDGAGVLGIDWAARETPLLIRATSRLHALRWAEGLLSSGGFALVVLAGAEPQGTEPIRLVRAAHEGGGACVALTARASMAALRVTSRFLPSGYRYLPGPFADPAAVRTATLEVRVRTPGWNERAEVVLPILPYDLRLSVETNAPDRRGVAR
jgi:hypothetical protein